MGPIDLQALMGQFGKIDEWITEWGISKGQVRDLYRKVHEVLAAAGKFKESAQYLVKLLKTYDGEDAAGLSGAEAEVRQLMVHSLKDPDTFELSSLASLDAFAALPAEDPAKALLMVFKEGDLQGFQSWLAAGPDSDVSNFAQIIQG